MASESQKLAELLDEVAAAVEWPDHLGDVLAETLTEGAREMTTVEASLVAMLRHHVVEQADGAWSIEPVIPTLAPITDLGLIPESAWVEVRDLVEESAAPVGRALIGDVYWERKQGERPHELAAIAADAHTSIACDAEIASAPRARSIRRAFHLAQSMKDSARMEAARVAAQVYVEGHDQSAELRDVYLALDAVSGAREWQPWSDEALARLVDECQDPDLLTEACRLRGKVDPSLGSRAFDPVLTRLRESASRTDDALLRYTWLRRALELAQDVGHPDRAALRAQIQQVDPFEGIAAQRSTRVRSYTDVSRRLQLVVGNDSLHAALRRLARVRLFPTGDERAEFERQYRAARPVETSLGTTRLGSLGSIVTVEPQEAAGEHAVTKALLREVAEQSLYSLTPTLESILGAYQPSKAMLTDALLAGSTTSEPIASGIAESLLLLGEGQADPAACTVLPRIESLVRNYAAACGLVVTKDPIADKRGGVKALGEVLAIIRAAVPIPLDEATLWGLENVLVADAGGLNLRNDILHNTRDRNASGWEAALLIYCALLLVWALADEEPTSP